MDLIRIENKFNWFSLLNDGDDNILRKLIENVFLNEYTYEYTGNIVEW